MNKIIKLVIAGLFIGLSAYLFYQKEIGWGIFSIILGAITILLYFRNEFILLALYQMNKQNMPKVQYWLNKIKNPEGQLVKNQLGYFYYMKSMLKSQEFEHNKEAMKESEIYMKKALDHGLSQKNDLAGAKLSMAMIALNKGKKKEAEILLTEAKKLDTAGILTEQIKSAKKQLKMLNINMNNLQNPMYRNRGKFK